MSYLDMALHIIRLVSYSVCLVPAMMLYHLIFAEVFLIRSLRGLCDGQACAGGRREGGWREHTRCNTDQLFTSAVPQPQLLKIVWEQTVHCPGKHQRDGGVITDGFNLRGSQNEHGDKAVNFAWEAMETMNPAGAARPCCTDVSYTMW